MKKRVVVGLMVGFGGVVGLGAGLVGCGLEGEACTEIGCDSQLDLRFIDSGGDPIREMQGVLSYGDVTIEFDCIENAVRTEYMCLGEGEIRIFDTPPSVTLTAEDAEGNRSFDGTIEPEYVTLQPNGEDCPPTCEQAREDVILLGENEG